MSLVNKVKAFITGRTDEERLAEIGEQIAAAEKEVAWLDGERRRFIVARVSGDSAAAERVADIDRAAQGLRERVADLRQAKAEVEIRLAAARQAAATEQEEARRRRVIGLRRSLAERTRRIDDAAARLAAEMKAAQAEMRDLAEVGDSQPLRRWSQTLPQVMRNGITNLFVIDPAAPARPENNLLGLVSGWTGERAHWGVARFFEDMLDVEAAVFADEAQAAACRDRLAARGMRGFVIPLQGGLFHVLQTPHAFATQAEAEAAMRTVSMFRGGGHRIVPWEGAWLILPANLAVALPTREAA
jgi:hypothetical protein